MTSNRILLIDDHAMFRSGLGMVIKAGLPGAEISEAGSLDEAINSAPDSIDVVLLDIQLKGLNGLEGIALLKRRWPLAPILMLSSQDEPETVSLALSRGATAFVSKSESAEKIVETLRLFLRGEFPAFQPTAGNTPSQRLTPRQCEVLDLLHQGLSNKLIARRLSLSENTVRRHVQDILAFFGVTNRSEAVFEARRQALVG
jgi:DNA-binding NarL/FixJ family response regulator